MKPLIEVTHTPSPAEREAILGPLAAYNESKVGRTEVLPLAVLLRDPANRRIIGGLTGRSLYDWLFVEWLAVPEGLRGQGLGSDLMGRAEAVARARRCVGVWLDTFEFQARPFYEKLGYSVFGQIDDFPRGSCRYFLQKRL
jgi:GNAT superfamily N-acetyltransferase